MRRTHAACALGAALALVSGVASAQKRGGAPPGGATGNVGPQSMTLQKEQLGTDAFAGLARTRMRNGDCAGALDLFDSAILHSIDVTLRRDRGLCQEQLGHPFPAMDDYRAYLAAQPDAADSDGIRARLARLVGDAAAVDPNPPSKPVVDDDIPPNDDVPPPGASSSAGIQVSASTGEEHDRMDYSEHDNDVLSSSLRRGKGFSLAPYYSQHKWFFSGAQFGDPETWSEGVGLQLRYSFGHVPSLLVEGGYDHFNSDASTQTQPAPTITGVPIAAALELRFPLDAEYENEFIVLPEIGYEALTFSFSSGGPGSETAGLLVPQGRVGWRHMLSSSVGFDLAIGGGAAVVVSNSLPGSGSSSTTTPILVANLGLSWGL